jgi:5-methylcytosine-specific restriction endonuclease McrA
MEEIQFGDAYTCTYCLRTITWDHHRSRPTQDHFIPKSKLLKGDKTEFVLCCQWCNSRKSDKVFESIEAARVYIASRRPPKIPAKTD